MSDSLTADSTETPAKAKKTKVYGIITNIQVYSLHDGPGVRTMVFLKGCPLNCSWCCNPECISPEIEVEFYRSRCTGCGTCLASCPRQAVNLDLDFKTGSKINHERCDACGKCVETCRPEALKIVGQKVSVDEALEKIRKDKYFYLTSQGGVTISGGEPLYQIEFTQELLRQAHNENIDTAIETCGAVPWEYYQQVLPYLDLILFDIKHMDPEKHRQATGAANRLILDNLTKLSRSGVNLILRLPLIPDFNLDPDNIKRLGEFIAGLDNVSEVNLMPFHQLGKDKHQRLGRDYILKDMKALDSTPEGVAKIKEAKKTLEGYGLKVTVGG